MGLLKNIGDKIGDAIRNAGPVLANVGKTALTVAGSFLSGGPTAAVATAVASLASSQASKAAVKAASVPSASSGANSGAGSDISSSRIQNIVPEIPVLRSPPVQTVVDVFNPGVPVNTSSYGVTSITLPASVVRGAAAPSGGGAAAAISRATSLPTQTLNSEVEYGSFNYDRSIKIETTNNDTMNWETIKAHLIAYKFWYIGGAIAAAILGYFGFRKRGGWFR